MIKTHLEPSLKQHVVHIKKQHNGTLRDSTELCGFHKTIFEGLY